MINDLRNSWLNVARRLQDVACNITKGYSIITIRILANSKGEAIAWSNPTETRLEPGKADFEDVLSLILGEMSSDKDKHVV
jgi:hypothetical protein